MRRAISLGAWAYLATTLPVILGVCLSIELAGSGGPKSGLEAIARHDGARYREIAVNGYSYTPGTMSNVAFFPGYPLLAQTASRITGLAAQWAVVFASNACLAAAFIGLSAYSRLRLMRPSVASEVRSIGQTGIVAHSESVERTVLATLLAFGLLPNTFFCRMAYSEAMFVLVTTITLYAFEAQWAVPLRCALVGAATAIRPVGISLILPLAVSILRQPAGRARLALRLAYAPWLAVWGIGAYMTYQYVAFGDAFAFVKAQAACRLMEETTVSDKLSSLICAAPLWGVYDAASPGFWQLFGSQCALLNLQFANPVYFIATATLVIVGARLRWLSLYELLTSAGLLAVPYVLRGFDTCMLGQARFAVVVVPAYLVLGRLSARLPPIAAFSVVIASSSLLLTYTVLFAVNRPFY